jgi:iron complex transport system substrate-binding protein
LFYALLASATSAEAEFPRLVSLNPSITEIVIALDALPALVGVDDYSARTQPEVSELPRVGGLFNPSLEGIVALEPDLVVLVPSAQQRNLRERLEALGAEVLILENISLSQVFESIEVLGERLGRSQAASERVAAIRSAWGAIERDSSTRAPKRAVLVLQRDPIYLVGAGSFLDDMLRVAGVKNLAAESFNEPYPRASLEWLIAMAPEFILDSSESSTVADQYWGRWPSLPAVQNARVVTLPTSITRPGPYLDRALDTLTQALHDAESFPMLDTEVGE